VGPEAPDDRDGDDGADGGDTWLNMTAGHSATVLCLVVRPRIRIIPSSHHPHPTRSEPLYFKGTEG